MVSTSIHTDGTATTTSAWPKPSGVTRWIASARSAGSDRVSWTRSRPVTPKCTLPATISRAISEADRKAISTPSMPDTPAR